MEHLVKPVKTIRIVNGEWRLLTRYKRVIFLQPQDVVPRRCKHIRVDANLGNPF